MFDDVLGRIADIDPQEIIRSFDADFDVPGRAAVGVGLLRMRGAFAAAPGDDLVAIAVRVGAHWCDIVHCDVQFDLASALALIDESEADAERLAGREDLDDFAAYCLARWLDGSGKVLYRIGSYFRGRMNFQRAIDVAARQPLWWCLPDLRSNSLRSQLEEARQAGAERKNDAAAALANLEVAVTRTRASMADRRIVLAPRPVAPEDRQLREYLRGYSSLLHNLSWAVGGHEPARSLALSHEAEGISDALGDEYRLAQAMNQQALLISGKNPPSGVDRCEADRIFASVRQLGWLRGRRIAEQQQAKALEPLTAAEGLANLLSQLEQDVGRTGRSAGLDVDLRWYTVDALESAAKAAHEADRSNPRGLELLKLAREAKIVAARSVRRVIALPAYKRAYGMTIRPVYLERLERLRQEYPDGAPSPVETREEQLSLIEESTGRELLDLMSSVDLPTLSTPASGSAATSPDLTPPAPGSPEGDLRPTAPTDPRGVRRTGPRRASPEQQRADHEVLARREREFEQQFLNRPLQAAPHDEEIARRAAMYVANHPGTRFVRYFASGWAKGRPERLGAFVIGESVSEPIDLGPFERGREIVAQLLTDEPALPEVSAAIWEHLLAALWPRIQDAEHLVLVPTDDLFAVPFHIAAPDPEEAGEAGRPLAVRTRMSQSVSLTAFLTRGRHLLRRQRTTHNDDLAGLVVRNGISGAELVGTGWRPEHVRIAGMIPDGLVPGHRHEADWAGLAALTACRPEFFVYAGHGRYVDGFGDLGPYLQLGPTERLTSYDVALRLRLPRNVLTVVGACLAGQGSSTQGGDLAGFLRAFIAAGSGTLGLPMWPVFDRFIADTTRHLLQVSRPGEDEESTVFDVVDALHRHYCAVVDDPDYLFWWDRMPLALYT